MIQIKLSGRYHTIVIAQHNNFLLIIYVFNALRALPHSYTHVEEHLHWSKWRCAKPKFYATVAGHQGNEKHCTQSETRTTLAAFRGLASSILTIRLSRLPDAINLPTATSRALATHVHAELSLILTIINIQVVVCLLFFYTIPTVFQLYHGGDIMEEMRRRKPEPTDSRDL